MLMIRRSRYLPTSPASSYTQYRMAIKSEFSRPLLSRKYRYVCKYGISVQACVACATASSEGEALDYLD